MSRGVRISQLAIYSLVTEHLRKEITYCLQSFYGNYVFIIGHRNILKMMSSKFTFTAFMVDVVERINCGCSSGFYQL